MNSPLSYKIIASGVIFVKEKWVNFITFADRLNLWFEL